MALTLQSMFETAMTARVAAADPNNAVIRDYGEQFVRIEKVNTNKVQFQFMQELQEYISKLEADGVSDADILPFRKMKAQYSE